MSLDIGNVTSNLNKVASETKKLGNNMASSFGKARTELDALNNTIKQDVKDFGALANVKAHVDTLGKELAAPFASMVQSARTSVDKTKAYLSELSTAFKQDTAEYGFFNTLAAHLEPALSPIKSAFNSITNVSLSDLKNKATATFAALRNDMKMDGVFATLKTHIAGVTARLTTGFAGARSSVRQFVSSAMEPLATSVLKVQKRFDSFINNLTGKLYTGNKAVKELNNNVKATGVQFKDVARIVQGIMISQLFYSAINAIQGAANAVWDFAKALEYSNLVYTNFFGNTDLAQGYLDVLKEFSAQTRFSYNELNQASQQLVAYGFQAKNLMYVLQGVTAAASISGDADKMESISRALGQIYTKGRLMSEEMRQLAEAGIPAYDILQKKLGLTYEQLQNLGDQAIPASTAINALIDGITERFGGLLDYSNMTITGLVSNIGDLGLQIAQSIFAPVIGSIRKVLIWVAKGLAEINDVVSTSGLGGLFEHLIPPELQDIIRNIIASIISLVISLGQLWQAFERLGAAMRPIFFTWLNGAITIVATFARVLASVATFVSKNTVLLNILAKALILASAAWLVFKARAAIAGLSAMVIGGLKAMSAGLLNLASGLVAVAQHPALLFFLTLIGLILVLTGTLGKARDAMNSFFSSLNGKTAGTILQPKVVDKSKGSINDYNKALDGSNDGLDKLGKNANKAKAAAKKLADSLSFDEVYKLNMDDGSDGDGTDDVASQWEDLLGDLAAGDADFSGLFDNMDFGDFASDFVKKLADSLNVHLLKDFGKMFLNGFKTIEFNNALLAALGAAMAIAVLGFTPAGIFTALGMILFGAFWDDFAKAFGLKADVDLGTLILGAVAAAVALATLGLTPVGLFVGLAALFVGAFWDDLTHALTKNWNVDLGQLALAAVVAALSIAIAGFTPLGIFSALAALFVAGFWDDLAKAFGIKNANISLSEVILTAVSGTALGLASGLKGGTAIWTVFTVALVASFWDELLAQFGLTYKIDLSTVVETAIIAVGAACAKSMKAGIWTALVAVIVLGFQDELKAAFGESVVQQQIVSAVSVGLVSALASATKGNVKLQTAIAGIGVYLVQELLRQIGKEFKKSKDDIEQSISASVGGALVGGIGAALVGLPIGITAVVAAAAAGLILMFKDEIEEVLYSDDFQKGFVIVWAGALGLALGGVPGLIVGAIAAAAYAIIATFKDELLAQVEYMVDSIGNDLNALWAPVADYFNFDGKTLAEIGLNIVLGILEGIKAAILGVGAILYRILIEPIITAIKDLFGIHSPATTMEPIGKYLIEGIFVGISNTMSWLVTGIGGFVDTVVSAFDGWFDGVGTKAKNWCKSVGDNITSWADSTGLKIGTWVKNRTTDFATWSTNTGDKVTAWATDTGTKISTWSTTTGDKIGAWATSAKTSISTWATNTKDSVATWATNTGDKISGWATNAKTNISTWATNTGDKIAGWATSTKASISGWVTSAGDKISGWATSAKGSISGWSTSTGDTISGWAKSAKSSISTWVTSTKDKFTGWADSVSGTIDSWSTSGISAVGTFCSTALASIGSWAKSVASTVSSALSSAWDAIDGVKSAASAAASSVSTAVGNAWDKLGDLATDAAKALTGSKTTTTTKTTKTASTKTGHATGGVFNREHIARFAEGNKAEAIIPLENETAMQPFVDAVANGLTQSLAPIMSSITNKIAGGAGGAGQQPLYVGTLIADERGLKELNRKMKIINATETSRIGG